MSLVTLSQPNAAAAEAYRTLRTNLHFAALDAPLASIVIASPDIAAASADAVANLAVVCAQSERRVIAIDANLRQPQLHERFGLTNSAGVIEALLSTVPGSAPALQNTTVPGLRVLTAGTAPAVASDAVSSTRMVALIAALREQADLVLINAAPVAAFSDAAILAAAADGAVLVVSRNKTRRDALQTARDAFARAKARLVGAVLV
jgi:capsular exopolysaccharide synthesis family protein